MLDWTRIWTMYSTILRRGMLQTYREEGQRPQNDLPFQVVLIRSFLADLISFRDVDSSSFSHSHSLFYCTLITIFGTSESGHYSSWTDWASSSHLYILVHFVTLHLPPHLSSSRVRISLYFYSHRHPCTFLIHERIAFNIALN